LDSRRCLLLAWYRELTKPACHRDCHCRWRVACSAMEHGHHAVPMPATMAVRVLRRGAAGGVASARLPLAASRPQARAGPSLSLNGPARPPGPACGGRALEVCAEAPEVSPCAAPPGGQRSRACSSSVPGPARGRSRPGTVTAGPVIHSTARSLSELAAALPPARAAGAAGSEVARDRGQSPTAASISSGRRAFASVLSGR
jgi:hypothetical protein